MLCIITIRRTYTLKISFLASTKVIVELIVCIVVNGRKKSDSDPILDPMMLHSNTLACVKAEI